MLHQPDNYKDPEEPKKPDTPKPEKPKTVKMWKKPVPPEDYVANPFPNKDIPANSNQKSMKGNQTALACANKDKQLAYVSERLKRSEARRKKFNLRLKFPAGNGVNNNNRFGSNFNPRTVETFPKIQIILTMFILKQ